MDKEMFKKAKRGDMKAFETIFDDEFRKELYIIVMLKLKNDFDAKDAVQETILEAFYSLKNVRDPSKVKSWVIKVLMSKCNNIFRHNSRFEILQGERLIDYNVDTTVVQIEDSIDIYEMLSGLDPDERNILFMFSRGYTYDEISCIINMNENTVRSKVRRAKHKLRLKYGRGGYNERRY